MLFLPALRSRLSWARADRIPLALSRAAILWSSDRFGVEADDLVVLLEEGAMEGGEYNHDPRLRVATSVTNSESHLNLNWRVRRSGHRPSRSPVS